MRLVDLYIWHEKQIDIYIYIYIMEVEAAKRDLAHISRKEHQSWRGKLKVRVIKNSGHCNSLIDRLMSSA